MKNKIYKILSMLLCVLLLVSNVNIVHAEDTGYKYCQTATSGDVTLKIEWNEIELGQPTTFHVSATGGSGSYKFRMSAPMYSNPVETLYIENVADPSKGEWMNYTSECSSHDYSFTMTASGTYKFTFYMMDLTAGVGYLRSVFSINVSDENYPSVNSICESAVAMCNSQTDG